MVVAVGGVLLLKAAHPSTYTASTRLVLDTQDPTTRQEAVAIADTAKAIATSPTQVDEALRKAGVTGRDPAEVARDDVTVASVGSSGVLAVSVSSDSAKPAAAIANALSGAVMRTRLGSSQGVSRAVISDLDRRLGDLRERISRADAKLAALRVHGKSSGSAGDRLRARRQSFGEQESVLESERVSVLTEAASKPKPAIVSAATPPAHADRSGLAADVVLALLLGLIVGVGLAGLLEILRPTVVGSDAVAREFGAPLLGTLPAAPDQEGALTDLTAVTGRLSLAMGASGTSSVSLMAADPEVDLGALAARLDAVRPQMSLPTNAPSGARRGDPTGTPAAGEMPAHGSGGMAVRAPMDPVQSSNGHAVVGIVVVAPQSLSVTKVTDTTQLLGVGRIPVIGVITYSRSRG